MTGAFLRLSLKAGEAELSFLRTGVSPSKGELSQATEARVPSWIAINAEEIKSRDSFKPSNDTAETHAS